MKIPIDNNYNALANKEFYFSLPSALPSVHAWRKWAVQYLITHICLQWNSYGNTRERTNRNISEYKYSVKLGGTCEQEMETIILYTNVLILWFKLMDCVTRSGILKSIFFR